MALGSQESGAIGGAASGAAAGAAFGPWGIAAGAIIGGVAGFLGGGGEDEAQKLAEMQAKIIEDTSAENLRRRQLSLNQDLGGITAVVGASNIQMSGSAQRYRNAYEANTRREMAWDRNKAWMDAQAARAGGQVAASQIQSSAMSSMITGLGSAAGAGAFGSYSKKTPSGGGGYKPPWEI